ncbi:MAG: tyrosine-type recombinase/integrase [Campylobacter sp.]|uniref:tyrosine-type recombinase/integrase n=1 Tax=Campylobacter sp. TaxID=205 RepID=UPI001AFF7F34|nr:site-specific integrase [Campylobacter sp.]MBO5062882.1 tyrosine-type recombinase/integrase [Campylobacter sp.]MBO5062911.1 tyrosine-type recombinase/integrase [Campylobacter sp.]
MATRGRKLVREIELEACTLGTAAEEFYRHNKIEGLAKATQEAYRDYVGAFVKWCGEDTPADTIKVKTIEKYLEHKLEGGIKQVTAATITKHLRRFINFSIGREYMYHMEIKIPKYEVEQKEPYTDDEMKLLLAKPKSNNWVEFRSWAMINYFFSTGQRLSTVLNIKVEHLDLDNARVFLEWNKDKIKKHMPLSTAIIRILREYIELSDLQEQDYLFPEYEGGQLTVRGAEDAITKYNRSRGVEKTSIHLFRHTFAKNYIMNGGNPMKLQKLLNHKTIDMTMRYVNLYGNDISKDLDLFNPLDNFKRANYMETKRRKVG